MSGQFSTIFDKEYLPVQIVTSHVAQDYVIDPTLDEVNNVTFCTTSTEEQNKCLLLGFAAERDIVTSKLHCKQGANKDDCMMLLDQDLADITSLDAGEVFVGGRYHSLVPIIQETYDNRQRDYYSVAVIKRGSLPDVRRLEHLRGKKACFAGVGTLAGWTIPIYTLMKHGKMEIIDCNNHVKSAINYFGPSCAVDSLIDKYNPIGDNSDKLCQLCTGEAAGEKCTPADPYFGYDGAFKCLVEKGDVAFLRHSTIPELINKPLGIGVTRNINDFELLCVDGTRRPIEQYLTCNWGRTPSQAIVTSSAKAFTKRRAIQKFIVKLVELYGHKGINDTYPGPTNNNYRGAGYADLNERGPYGANYGVYENFNLFQSIPRYGTKQDLLFQARDKFLE
ncbi:hypothetical protein RUM44_001780 [Polyplax serrata]|uniref:Transferrin-like domain-containing protein n=1 Tax=Polyplax serrata TaxID=468196 RepID=A0ABR1AL02_POLSC